MFEKVLVGVDHHRGGRDAIALAKQLATPQAEITLAHVYKIGIMPGAAVGLLLDSDLAGARELLQEEADEASIDANVAVRAAMSIAEGLHDLAEDRDADLVVLGSCHRGLIGRILAGDDARATIHGSPCPVAIAPAGYATAPGKIARVGVGFDGAAESARVLAEARELAARHDAGLKVISVVETRSQTRFDSALVEHPQIAERKMRTRLRHLLGAERLHQEVAYGDPAKTLARFGADVDLLVVGSRNEGLLRRLLDGSACVPLDYLERNTDCPLLIIARGAEGSTEAVGGDAGQPKRALELATGR